MKLRRLFSLAALVAASLLLIGAESRAETILLPPLLGRVETLQTAINDGGFSVGDKNFALTPSSFSTIPSDSISASNINVIGVTSQTGGFGFELQGVFRMPISDIRLSYAVTSLGEAINGAELILGAPPGGTATVLETINGVGTLEATASNPFVSRNFTPQQSLSVNKDIIVGNSSFSLVVQTFTQVPEPTSLALLGVGLIGIPALHRIQRKRKPLVV